MGDVLSLIEKAQEHIDEKNAEELAKKLKENSFDLNDLLVQMQQLKKMGPLQQVMSMLPGASKAIKDEDAEKGEAQLKLMESIIYSMTPAERENPQIINPSRKKRIAAGSGTDVPAVNRLLKQFDQMQKMMKQFGGGGKKGKRRRMPMMPGGMPF